jgi:hypothetical protein
VSNALQKKSSLSLTVLLTLVIGCLAASGSQAQVPGTGIWMLRGTYHDYSITLVNLTNGQLITDSDPRAVVADHSCLYDDEAQPFVDPASFPGTKLVLGPYESVIWATYTRIVGTGCAHFWDGKITFLADFTDWSPPGTQWKFDLNFVSDKKSWLYKTGTWAYITPTSGASWWYQEGWGFTLDSYWPNISYLWTTLYGDGLMRNITLMEPNYYAPLTVSLYSQDNNNLVLVVQETAALQRAANATYLGYELDWVDNTDDNVPD